MRFIRGVFSSSKSVNSSFSPGAAAAVWLGADLCGAASPPPAEVVVTVAAAAPTLLSVGDEVDAGGGCADADDGTSDDGDDLLAFVGRLERSVQKQSKNL